MQATSQVERATTLPLAVWAALAAAVVVMPLRGRTVYTMTPPSDNGIITLPSQQSVDQTVERLTALLHAKGVTLFALVDHSGEAAKVGMKLSPTKLVIFGNPKAGTPLMLAAPSVAIDLPLKILVRSEEHTSELQSRLHLVCRLLLEKKKNKSKPRKRRASGDTCSGRPPSHGRRPRPTGLPSA